MSTNTNKKEKINIAKHVEKSEELIKMLNELKEKKKLYFHIYDGLKGFDLIMSVIGKEKIIEYFIEYMQTIEAGIKNYSEFVSFIVKKEGGDFLKQLETVYLGILKQYDSIKFGTQAHHFGTEEVYLRETLNKIKQILESLGKLNSKGSFMNFSLNFLGSKNDSLDFSFNNKDLEKIDFYAEMDSIEEENSGSNLLPFFHLLNSLMETFKETNLRVKEMATEFSNELSKDILALEDESLKIEKEYITKAKKEITTYLKKKDISELQEIIDEVTSKLENLERNKNLPQSILRKDAETLEKALEELERVI